MGQVTYVDLGTEDGKTSGADPAPGIPGAIQADDLLICAVSATVATAYATSAMTAAGFARRLTNNSNGSSPVQALFYKRALGTETGTVVAISPGGQAYARIFAYRSIDWVQPFGAGTAADAVIGYSTATGTYVVPTQTPEIAGCAAFLHGVANNASGSFNPNPTGYTELVDSTFSGTVSNNVMYHRLNLPVSATGVRNVARISGTVRGCALGVIIRPAPDATAEFEGWGVPL